MLVCNNEPSNELCEHWTPHLRNIQYGQSPYALVAHGRRAGGAGVSESIIMGIPVPCGTGMTKLVYAPPTHAQPTRRPDPLLQSY